LENRNLELRDAFTNPITENWRTIDEGRRMMSHTMSVFGKSVVGVLLYCSHLLFTASAGHAVNLEIAVARTIMLQGEPITARIVVTNESSETVMIVYRSNEEFAKLMEPEFSITSGSTDVVARSAFVAGPDYRSMRLTKLVQGASLVAERLFMPVLVSEEVGDRGSGGKCLPPGKYEMIAELPWPDGRLTSNSLAIDIVSPTGEEAIALDFIDPEEQAVYFTGRSTLYPPAKLAALLENHPGTIYARLTGLPGECGVLRQGARSMP
jgi:hypothetical protein